MGRRNNYLVRFAAYNNSIVIRSRCLDSIIALIATQSVIVDDCGVRYLSTQVGDEINRVEGVEQQPPSWDLWWRLIVSIFITLTETMSDTWLPAVALMTKTRFTNPGSWRRWVSDHCCISGNYVAELLLHFYFVNPRVIPTISFIIDRLGDETSEQCRSFLSRSKNW